MKQTNINKLHQAIILALGATPLLGISTSASAGIKEAADIGVYSGTPLTVNTLTTPFKAFSDYGALNQGWTHSAQFMTLTVGSEQDIANGKTYNVQLTLSGRGALGNSGTSAIDNPAFAVWTAGTGKLSPGDAFGQHGWNPTRGPNEDAINVAGAADKLLVNETFHKVGVLDGHVGWIGYVNAGPTYTLENTLDPLGGGPQTLSGKSVFDAVSHGAINTTSKIWLTNPDASGTTYTNNYFLQGETMLGSAVDSATMTLYGLKAGHYLIGTGGSCPTTPTPKTVCGIGTQFTFTMQPIITPGFKFADENSIPDNTDLTPALKTLHDPNDKTQPFALDLQQEVLPVPAKSLLEQLQALPALTSLGATLTQTTIGTLIVGLGNDVYALSPVKVFKTLNEPAGISVNQDGQVKVVTNEHRIILLNASVQSIQSLLDLNLSVNAINASNGNLTVTLSNSQNGTPYNSVRPAIKSETAEPGSTPVLYVSPYLSQNIANMKVAYLVFKDSKGQLRQQAFWPSPADWNALRRALEALNFSNVTLQNNGVISVTGSDNTVQQAMTSYQVTPSNESSAQVTFTSTADFNNDGRGDLQITYPNGDKQLLFLFQ